jgi:CRP-like cAMP-binding protein
MRGRAKPFKGGSNDVKNNGQRTFDAQTFLDSAGLSRKVAEFRRRQTIYAQGDPAKSVLYIQQGGVKLCIVSTTGKEAVVAMLGPGDFFGEGCLAGQTKRMGTAIAITSTRALVIDKNEMIRALHAEHAFSDRFISYMLSRNIRIEEDLVDQTVQLQRETAGAHASATRSLRKARPTRKSAPQNVARDTGGNDWHLAFQG